MNTYARAARGEYNGTKPYRVGLTPEIRVIQKAYQEEQAQLMAKFREDLFTEHGVTNNPKAGMAYAIAWDHGHASGYADVACFFADLVSLIK